MRNNCNEIGTTREQTVSLQEGVSMAMVG